MKPDDIRKLNMDCQVAATATKTPEAQDTALRSLELSLLAEIAAQLSEANGHLMKMANPLYTITGGIPWEEFMLMNAGRIRVDRRTVCGVQECGNGACNILAANGVTYNVIGEYEEVCARLGILKG